MTNKRALITGGTRGIGRAVVESLLSEGATVSFCSRNAEEVAKAVTELEAKCSVGRVFGSVVDAADPTALETWVAQCGEQMDGIDIVIPNASAGRGPRMDQQAWQANST